MLNVTCPYVKKPVLRVNAAFYVGIGCVQVDQAACVIASFDHHSRANLRVFDLWCTGVVGRQHSVLLEPAGILLRSLPRLVLARLCAAASRSGTLLYIVFRQCAVDYSAAHCWETKVCLCHHLATFSHMARLYNWCVPAEALWCQVDTSVDRSVFIYPGCWRNRWLDNFAKTAVVPCWRMEAHSLW